MLTQLESGDEDKDRCRSMCATNQILPAATLRSLVALFRHPSVGGGQDRSAAYAFDLERLLAQENEVSDLSLRPLPSSSNHKKGGGGVGGEGGEGEQVLQAGGVMGRLRF
jgi:hypothetical protein